jgi:hypothetical protein
MVPSQRYLGQPRAVTVTKVGRKWAEISERGYRVDLVTLYVDGGQHAPPARCYTDRAAHDAEMYREQCWIALRKHMDHKWTPPQELLIEQIKVAAMALGVELPPHP